MKRYTLILFLVFFLSACQKEEINSGTNVKDLFFLNNKGASMPVLVEGNTASKTILLIVHGGPGSDAMKTMNGPWMDTIEAKYAVAYWDQRNAGNTQGGANHNSLNVVPTMAEDLKKLVQLLKYRYGASTRIFLYSHSFGGCLAAAFLTTDDNQKLVNGWINIDGATNYPLNDQETKKMLISVGTSEKNAGRNTDQWTPIIEYAKANDPAESIKISWKFNELAYEAIGLIKDLNSIQKDKTNDLSNSPNSIFSGFINLRSVYVNSGMDEELFKIQFSDQLPKLTLPILNIFGKYDFVVPPAVGQDIMNRVKSRSKKMLILNKSAHDPYATEPEIVSAEIINFIK